MSSPNLLKHLPAKLNCNNNCKLHLSLRPFNHCLQHASSPPARGGVPEGGGGPMFSKQNALPILGNSLTLNNLSNLGFISTIKLNNRSYLKRIRKKLRNNMTPTEARLWILLKEKKLEGRKFRRQFSVANYVIDFYCPKEKLAIELDGAYHFTPYQMAKDKQRDAFLNSIGIRVLRFENKCVWNNPEGLLDSINSFFNKV